MSNFNRPKISWHDWEQEPFTVVHRVALELLKQIEPVNMTLAQQGIVFASHYRGTGISIHGTTLFNAFYSNDDGSPDEESLRLIPEALQTIGATSHVSIFNSALERWKSKPRPRRPVTSDHETMVAWSREVFDVVCDEFLDLDEQASVAKPNLETCLIDHLRKHRNEFVEIDRK